MPFPTSPSPQMIRLATPGVHVVVGFDTTGLNPSKGAIPLAVAMAQVCAAPQVSATLLCVPNAESCMADKSAQVALGINRLTLAAVLAAPPAAQVAQQVAQALAPPDVTLWGFNDAFQAAFMGALLGHAATDPAVQALGRKEIHPANALLAAAAGRNPLSKIKLDTFAPALPADYTDADPALPRCAENVRRVAALLHRAQTAPLGFYGDLGGE